MTSNDEVARLREAANALELAAITLARRLPREDPVRIAACKVIARYGDPLGILRVEKDDLEEEIKDAARALGFDPDAAPRCPKCDGPMVHTRLKGFVCPGRC